MLLFCFVEPNSHPHSLSLKSSFCSTQKKAHQTYLEWHEMKYPLNHHMIYLCFFDWTYFRNTTVEWKRSDSVYRAPKVRIHVLWKLSSLKIMDKLMDGYRIEREFGLMSGTNIEALLFGRLMDHNDTCMRTILIWNQPGLIIQVFRKCSGVEK